MCHWKCNYKGQLCAPEFLTLKSFAKWNATKPEASHDSLMERNGGKQNLPMMGFELLLQMEHYRASLQLMSSLAHWHQLKWLSRGYLLRVRNHLANMQLEEMVCVMGRRMRNVKECYHIVQTMQTMADTGLPMTPKKIWWDTRSDGNSIISDILYIFPLVMKKQPALLSQTKYVTEYCLWLNQTMHELWAKSKR